MIDKIKIRFFTNDRVYYIEKICYYERKNYNTGEVEYFNRKFRGFNIVLVGNTVTIEGSLHKFKHGNNCFLFTRNDLKEAVLEFCNLFKIEDSNETVKITYLEYGMNLLVQNLPLDYAEKMISYRGNRFYHMEPRKRTSKHYGCKCRTSDYCIKFYDKLLQNYLTSKPEDKKKLKAIKGDEQILRYEIARHRITGTKFQCSLKDLYSTRYMNLLLDDLQSVFNSILKVRVLETSKLTASQRRIYFLGNCKIYMRETKKYAPATYKKEKILFDNLLKVMTEKLNDLITELSQAIKDTNNILLGIDNIKIATIPVAVTKKSTGILPCVYLLLNRYSIR